MNNEEFLKNGVSHICFSNVMENSNERILAVSGLDENHSIIIYKVDKLMSLYKKGEIFSKKVD